MAEQVGLAPIGSNRAVHLDEGVTLALRGGVNEASQDVLADTGFSTDQQGRLRIRPPPDRYEVKDSRGLQDGRDTFGLGPTVDIALSPTLRRHGDSPAHRTAQ